MTPFAVADGRKVGALTREQAIDALKEYARLYGDDFPSAAFNPGNAKWSDRRDLIERYRAGRPDGSRWPSLNAIKALFPTREHPRGSFSEARRAAGLEANTPGPARRSGVELAPIRDEREHIVYVQTDKSKQAAERAQRAEAQLARARARAERAEVLLAEERARRRAMPRVREPRERVVRERVVVSEPVVKTKTITKQVKVRDERALERMRLKLEDERTARRAESDQLRAAVRDRDAARRSVAGQEVVAEQAVSAAREAHRERKAAQDAARALEARVERLRDELEDARAEALRAGEIDVQATEAAVVSKPVREAEVRVERAELRAARAEREMVEQAAAITGEQRRLTQAELVELRASGPQGPAVMAAALKRLASARAGRGDIDAALAEVARAAMGWRDRL